MISVNSSLKETLLLVECCLMVVWVSFTSTETEGLLGTGARDSHLDFNTAPELWTPPNYFGIYCTVGYCWDFMGVWERNTLLQTGSDFTWKCLSGRYVCLPKGRKHISSAAHKRQRRYLWDQTTQKFKRTLNYLDKIKHGHVFGVKSLLKQQTDI